MEDNNIKWWKSKTQNIVAFMALVFMFSFLTLLCFKEIPNTNRDIVNILIAMTFQPLIGAVVLYLFNYKNKNDVEPKSKTENE